jgi:hypothetical protein
MVHAPKCRTAALRHFRRCKTNPRASLSLPSPCPAPSRNQIPKGTPKNQPPKRSRSYELLPKNSNNSPRDMISQNNSIVISVCTLACAARFRANAGSKSVGMIGRPHAQPSCAETTLTGPLQFPYRARNLATSAVGSSSNRPALGGQATHQR